VFGLVLRAYRRTTQLPYELQTQGGIGLSDRSCLFVTNENRFSTGFHSPSTTYQSPPAPPSSHSNDGGKGNLFSGVHTKGPTKGNANQRTTCRTQHQGSVSSELERVREAAKKDRKARFTALFHHLTLARLPIPRRCAVQS